MYNQQPNVVKLEKILRNENVLKDFLIYILISKEKVPSSEAMIKSGSYKDIEDVIKIENSIDEEIIIDINCNGLAIRENNEGDLIAHVTLYVKSIENNNFRITRIDIMATGDGKSHAIHRGTELTKFYSKRHHLIMSWQS